MDHSAGPSGGGSRRDRIGRSTRRRFLLGATSAALLTGSGVLPAGAHAERSPAPPPSGRLWRIGYVGAGWRDDRGVPTWGYYQAFLLGLRDLGYIPGTNVTLEARFAEGRLDQIRGLVGELVGLPVDVLVLGATRAIREAMQATSTLPLVMAISNDPVGAQMVDSLSRPGGHLTGLTTNALALIPQELQLLRDVAPHVSRLTILGNRDTKAADQEFDAAQKAAAALGMDAVLVEESDPTRFRSRLRATRSHALFVLPDVIMNWNVGLLAALAADGSVGAGPVPALYGNGDFVRAGGLLALGPNRPAMYYRAAAYVDKILSGNSPGNLPIEGPPSLHRGVNVRAAQTLRVSVPKHILDDADFIAS